MNHLSRREFLEQSLFSAAAAAVAASAASLAFAAPASAPKVGANERLQMATIGVNGQGGNHVTELMANKEVELVAICDVDPAAYAKQKKKFDSKKRQAPEYVQDIRKLLERKDIDAVTIATPNHWHALAAIWAMQAGKDVYVEKPVSHNVSEGRRMVEIARNLGRICQTGTQSRSMSGMRQALDFIHSGKIGKVTLAKGFCYKKRDSIGKATGPCPVPEGLDVDLWIGPAPKDPIVRKKFHYDWHWFWAYGSGDLGNQGIHEMDKARWGLGKSDLPRRVYSLGGRFGYEDDGQTANTQLCFFDWDDARLIFELRGLKTDAFYKGKLPNEGKKKREARVGNIWYGSNGYVVSTSYDSGTAFDLDAKQINHWSGGKYADHFANFIHAVRSRRHEDLNADIEQGHLSSALCHLGNISYRLGTLQSFVADPARLPASKEAAECYLHFEEHLKANGVNLANAQVRAGCEVTLDPAAETTTCPDCNKLLTREYRKGFEVPAKA